MTDKEKIKQEIERRIDLYSIAEKDDSAFARMGELSSLMDFIDSLPEEPTNCVSRNDELEEEINNYIKDNFCTITSFGSGRIGFLSNRTKGELDRVDLANIARHFAEWQREKNKQLIGATQKISHQHGYDEGRVYMREEMMKDAVDAFVNTYENTDDSNYVEFVTEQSPYKFKELEKCKLIIIKEKQQ